MLNCGRHLKIKKTFLSEHGLLISDVGGYLPWSGFFYLCGICISLLALL